MNDLENFRIKQATDIERWMETKFSQLDDKIDVTFEEQETYLKGYIDVQKHALQSEADRYFSNVHQDLMKSEEDKLRELRNFKLFIDEQLLKIRQDMGERFYEQHAHNDEIDSRLKLVLKKLTINGANFEIGIAKMQSVNDEIVENARLTEIEYHKMLDVIVSMMES